MAEESDVERNYPATPRRLEQARERGQVARSRELATAGIALAAAGGVVALGPALATASAEVVRRGLTMDRAAAFSDDHLLRALSELSTASLFALIPLLLVIVSATLLAPMLLSGWVFAPQALVPDFKRLDPLKGLFQRVLQNLLDENVHVRDLRTILETLADHAPRTQDANDLTAAVRVALGRAIVQQLFGNTPELSVIAIDPELERMLQQVLGAAGDDGGGLEPELAETLAREIAAAAQQQEAAGTTPVLLVADRLRLAVSRLMRRAAPSLAVLAHGEIPDARTIRVRVTVGGKR